MQDQLNMNEGEWVDVIIPVYDTDGKTMHYKVLNAMADEAKAEFEAPLTEGVHEDIRSLLEVDSSEYDFTYTLISEGEYKLFTDNFDEELQGEFWIFIGSTIAKYRQYVIRAAMPTLLKHGALFGPKAPLQDVLTDLIHKVVKREFEEFQDIYEGMEPIDTTFYDGIKRIFTGHIAGHLFPSQDSNKKEIDQEDISKVWIMSGFFGELQKKVYSELWPLDIPPISEDLAILISAVLQQYGALDGDGKWVHGGSEKYILSALYEALKDKEKFVTAKNLAFHLGSHHSVKITEKSIRTPATSPAGKIKDQKAKRKLLALIQKNLS